MTDELRTIDPFDRLLGLIDGLPDYSKTRPSTVTTVTPLLGISQTYVVQTYKDREGGYTVFLQMVDSQGRARIAIPPKVTAAIYRQRGALVKTGRSQRGRDRWDSMSDAERDAAVSRLRKPR